MIKIENAQVTVATAEGKTDHRRVCLTGPVRIWIEELKDDMLKDVDLGDKYVVTIAKV